jgi:integrase
VFTVTVALGLRQGEILGLSWRDIDFETGVLNVRHALQRVNGKLIKVEPKSASSRRPITLPAVAISVLCAHRMQQEQERQLSGSDWQDSGLCSRQAAERRWTRGTSSAGFMQS